MTPSHVGISKHFQNIEHAFFYTEMQVYTSKPIHNINQRSQTRGPRDVLVRPATSFIELKNED